MRTNLYNLCNFAMKGFLRLYHQQGHVFMIVWTVVWEMLCVSLRCHDGKTVQNLINATPFMVENSEEKWLHHIFRENTFTFISAPPPYGTQTSVVGIVTRLQGRGYGVQIWVGERDSFLFQNIQTSSWAHWASYLMGVCSTHWPSCGSKVAGAWCAPVTCA